MPEVLKNDQNVIGPEGQGPITMNPEEKGPEGIETPQGVQEAGQEGAPGTEQAVKEAFAGTQEAGMPAEAIVAPSKEGEMPPTEARQLEDIKQEITNLTGGGQETAHGVQAEAQQVGTEAAAAVDEVKTGVEQVAVTGGAFAQALTDKLHKQEAQGVAAVDSAGEKVAKKPGFFRRLFGDGRN